MIHFFTITFSFNILLDAIVKAIVSAKGNPSGIAETARAITDKNISCSISVPIKRNYLVKSKDKIQNPFNTEIMNWDDFLAIPNIKNNL